LFWAVAVDREVDNKGNMANGHANEDDYETFEGNKIPGFS